MSISKFDKLGFENREIIESRYQEEIMLIRKNFDAQMDLMGLYLLVIDNDPYVEQDEYTLMLFSAIYKNFITIYSAIELTLNGLYGSARILFRNIFEFQIIAKATALRQDTDLLKKWQQGEDISLRREVFSKIQKPNSPEIKELWKTLCQFTHGTVYSQQVKLKYEDIKDDVKFNIVCLKILLDMNYHLMNAYAANNSIQYYTEFMSDLQKEDSFKNKKKLIQNQLTELRRNLQPQPKKVIYDYKLKWIFKS